MRAASPAHFNQRTISGDFNQFLNVVWCDSFTLETAGAGVFGFEQR